MALRSACSRLPCLLHSSRVRSISHRTFSTSSSTSRRRTCAAIAFDIDGVLLRGKTLIPEATRAIKQVTSKQDGGDGEGIPHIFLTNGGGVPEPVKAQQLANHFNVQIDPHYVVCSHTPMRDLVAKYGNGTVLVAGMSAVRQVAHYYGFKHVVTPEDLMHNFPQLVPHITEKANYQQILADYRKWKIENDATLRMPSPEQLRSISAILVLHDPLDWYRDLQLVTDVLLGYIHSSPPTHEAQHVPIYFSNPDLLFSGRAPHPRLAQGAFRVAAAALFKAISGDELKYTLYGKPERVTYEYAEKLLLERARAMGYDDIDTIYGIGDNPHADIRGANNAGGRWKSVLVKTGTIKSSPVPSDQPAYTFDHVDDAVRFISHHHHQLQFPRLKYSKT